MNYSPLAFETPIYELEEKLEKLKQEALPKKQEKMQALRMRIDKMRQKVYGNLSRWERVLLARHPNRPYFLDFVQLMTTDFVELHGDRGFAEDAAIIGGFATIGTQKVMIMGTQKGRNVKENLHRNFGMPHPEGYRKALRLMKMAEKFSLPIITLIDTPGAYPGLGAEERGQAEAIARNLREMAILKVPSIAVVTGEGGSGGALALAVTDQVLMLENAIYSVISPEGCASILFRDAAKANIAAESLKVTAADLKSFHIVDEVIEEPVGGAHRYPRGTTKLLKQRLLEIIGELQNLSPEQRIEQRIAKYRNMGEFHED